MNMSEKVVQENSIFPNITGETDDDLLNKAYQNEETDNFILSIREELMQKVMDECCKIYLKKQTIKFVVQCVYDALVKYISFNFYYHPECPDTTQSIWIPDKPVEPSPKDTWAFGGVPVRPASFKAKQRDSNVPSSNGSATADEMKCCMCLEHICTCLVTVQDRIATFEATSDRVCLSDEKLGSNASKQSGVTTKTSSGSSNTVQSSESKKYVKKHPKTSKASAETKEEIDKGESVTEIKGQDEGKKGKSGSQLSLLKLPPIRVNSTFYSKPVTKTKKKS